MLFQTWLNNCEQQNQPVHWSEQTGQSSQNPANNLNNEVTDQVYGEYDQEMEDKRPASVRERKRMCGINEAFLVRSSYY